jgi:hypothetical protein
MASSSDLKAIYTEAYPLIEQQLDLADLIAGLREKATAIGLDWSQIKALLKAQIQDERDETGGRKRVRKIIDKAEHASAYADMLGLANMNEKNFSADEFDAETGEVIEDQPETATEFHPPVTTREGHQGDPSPTLGERDLAEVGTGQKRAALPQEPYTATNHQSTGVLPAGGSSPSASEIDEIADPAQPSPPKQAEPIKAGEGVPPSSPAILSDEEVVPAFMKDKPGCLKLRDGHCKIGFATEALCAECADKRARAMA